MQNFEMGYDARAVTNALLDIADSENIELDNLAINKILFFCHSDSLIERQHGLIELTFEAWKYGPVLPVIYHQFKKHGSKKITSRATKLCRSTGNDIEVTYTEICESLPFLEVCLKRYGTLSSSALVSLSHLPGEPWDLVWNSRISNHHGMKISDELIQSVALGRFEVNQNGNKYVQ